MPTSYGPIPTAPVMRLTFGPSAGPTYTVINLCFLETQTTSLPHRTSWALKDTVEAAFPISIAIQVSTVSFSPILLFRAAGRWLDEEAQAEVLLPGNTDRPPQRYRLQMLLVALIGESLPQLGVRFLMYFLSYKAIAPWKSQRGAHVGRTPIKQIQRG